MILQRLKDFFPRMPDASPTMYKKSAVKWAVDLDGSGNLVGYVPLSGGGSSTRDRGKPMLVPTVVKTSGIRAILLADNAEYALGLPKDSKTTARHRAFCDLVKECADSTKDADVEAVVKFLEARAGSTEDLPKEMKPEDVVTFRVNDRFPVNTRSVQDFWARASQKGQGEQMQCLICGNVGPAEESTTIKIKGIPGGQPSGTAVISANAPAFESYGLRRNLTSPVCRSCSEAFAKSINYMIEADQHHLRVGPIIFLFWTREENEFSPATLVSKPGEKEVQDLIDSHRTGKWSQVADPPVFYATAFSASGGRAVVRDWLETTVPRVKMMLARWFALQRIVETDGAPGRPFGVYALAASLYLKPNEQMVANVPRALIRCALQGGSLPDWLLAQALRRNVAEQGVTRNRAALIKAVLLSQIHDIQEGYMEKLDSTCKSPGYLCGRLLAELEAAQYQALQPTATLVDRFYGAASSSPAIVFGNLLRGLQAHMAKLRKDRPRVFHAIDGRLQDIMSQIGDFPKTLNLKEQALFALGYYHQKAANRAAAIAHKEENDTQAMEEHGHAAQ